MVIINEERIKKLKEILNKYPEMISDEEIGDSIIKTFRFEKPLVSIELYDRQTEKVLKFIEELEDFFFIGQIHFPESQKSDFSGLIFISRFRNIFDVAIHYVNKHKGLLDEFADLSGILYGYTCKDVARYCSKERLKKFNLIK